LGTWAESAITYKGHQTHGNLVEQNYEVAGVNTNTGGTITLRGIKKVRNWVVQAYRPAAMVAAQESRIVDTTQPNTLVITYTDPTEAHKVLVTVWGVKG